MVLIRPATIADASAIGAVFDAAVLHGWTHIEGIADLVPMFGPKFWQETTAGYQPPDALLVATDEASGRVVGYTATHGVDGELFLLFVDPAYAGRGVGRELLRAAHDELRAAGHHEVFLYTHEHNRRATRPHPLKPKTAEPTSIGFGRP